MTTPPTVLLNVDAGEHDDEPEALYALAHSLNIASGGHAGDDASMERVLRACLHHGVRAGAHPSYPDRASFGRVSMLIEPAALARSVREQCARLAVIAARVGVPLAHAKLHGALYHDANRDPALAALVLGAIREVLGPVIIVGPPRGEHSAKACRSSAKASQTARCAPTAPSSRAASPAR